MMMGTGISTTVTPIGVIVYDARAIIRTGVLAFGGDIFRGHPYGVKKGARVDHFGLLDTDFCHLTTNVSKTVSRRVRHMSVRN